MIDLDAVIRAYLAGAPAPTTTAGKPGYSGQLVTAIVGERIYAGTSLPTGYNPTPERGNDDSGPAILFTVRGGPPQGQQRAVLLFPIVQIRCYGEDEGIARVLDRAVFDSLHDAKTAAIRNAWLSIIGQLGREPDPRGWPYVLSTYRMITRAS